MIADRKRMEEVMAEERSLWDTERDLLKSRIRELETALFSSTQKLSLSLTSNTTVRSRQQVHSGSSAASPLGSQAVSSGSVDSSGRRSVTIPQESGRNADGSPFYAPAPRNPSRTFHTSSSASPPLTIGSIIEPRESAIRVTSKELTSSDFGVQSPERELPPIQGSPIETIDISHIQPELEGVPIKASAVDPVFAARVLSPVRTPAKLSPNGVPIKPADVTKYIQQAGSAVTSPRSGKLDAAEVRATLKEPENRRLTLYAGHTPNHSLSMFEFVESGGVTPTQTRADGTHVFPENPSELPHPVDPIHPMFEMGEEQAVVSEDFDDMHEYGPGEGDRELQGPLGLINESATDDFFLTKLTEKLEEVSKSGGASPDERSVTSSDSRSLSPVDERGRRRNKGGLRKLDEAEEGEEAEVDVDVPPLRLKPSSNFGRPLGSM